MDTKYIYIYGRDRWIDGQKGLNDRWIQRIYIYGRDRWIESIDGQNGYMSRNNIRIEGIDGQKGQINRKDRWIEMTEGYKGYIWKGQMDRMDI